MCTFLLKGGLVILWHVVFVEIAEEVAAWTHKTAITVPYGPDFLQQNDVFSTRQV